MTTERPQAGAEASTADAPASSDKGEAKQGNRIQEFFASVTETEAPELRKHIRTLLEPDFQAQDKKWQKRHSDAEKRAREAEQALHELSEPEIADRYRQEQGSLAKAKERLQKKGLPPYLVRNARSFDDLWEAEDDWQKHNASPASPSAAAENGADPEDAAFLERLKRLGVPVGATPSKGATGEVVITGGRPVATGPKIDKDNIDALYLEGKVSGEKYAAFLRTGQL